MNPRMIVLWLSFGSMLIFLSFIIHALRKKHGPPSTKHRFSRWLYLFFSSFYGYVLAIATIVSFATSSDGALGLGKEFLGNDLDLPTMGMICGVVITGQILQFMAFGAITNPRFASHTRFQRVGAIVLYASTTAFSMTLAMACWLDNVGVTDAHAERTAQQAIEGFEVSLDQLDENILAIELASKTLATASHKRAKQEDSQGGTCGLSSPGKGAIWQLRMNEKEATSAVAKAAPEFANRINTIRGSLETTLNNSIAKREKESTHEAVKEDLRVLVREVKAYRDATTAKLAPYKNRNDLEVIHPKHNSNITIACPDLDFTRHVQAVDVALTSIVSVATKLTPPRLFNHHSAMERWFLVFELLFELLTTFKTLLTLPQLIVLFAAPLTDICVLSSLLLRRFDRKGNTIHFLHAEAWELCERIRTEESPLSVREIQHDRRLFSLDQFAIEMVSNTSFDALLWKLAYKGWAREGALGNSNFFYIDLITLEVLERELGLEFPRENFTDRFTSLDEVEITPNEGGAK